MIMKITKTKKEMEISNEVGPINDGFRMKTSISSKLLESFLRLTIFSIQTTNHMRFQAKITR